jgi:hypothetical protein
MLVWLGIGDVLAEAVEQGKLPLLQAMLHCCQPTHAQCYPAFTGTHVLFDFVCYAAGVAGHW